MTFRTAVVSFVGLVGIMLITAKGGMVSTVQVYDAGEGSPFPAMSVANTINV